VESRLSAEEQDALLKMRKLRAADLMLWIFQLNPSLPWPVGDARFQICRPIFQMPELGLRNWNSELKISNFWLR
jgi:hypothetical protein